MLLTCSNAILQTLHVWFQDNVLGIMFVGFVAQAKVNAKEEFSEDDDSSDDEDSSENEDEETPMKVKTF